MSLRKDTQGCSQASAVGGSPKLGSTAVCRTGSARFQRYWRKNQLHGHTEREEERIKGTWTTKFKLQFQQISSTTRSVLCRRHQTLSVLESDAYPCGVQENNVDITFHHWQPDLAPKFIRNLHQVKRMFNGSHIKLFNLKFRSWEAEKRFATSMCFFDKPSEETLAWQWTPNARSVILLLPMSQVQNHGNGLHGHGIVSRPNALPCPS